MNSVYYVSLLQYRYTQSLGEVLNIGVLLLFPEQQKATFLYPKQLGRIRKLYPKFAEKVIRSYFKGITYRVNQLAKHPDLFFNLIEHQRQIVTNDILVRNDNVLESTNSRPSLLRQIIDNEILIRDSSALEFSDPKPGFLFTNDVSIISEQYYKLYLSFYDQEEYVIRHDESYLLKQYQKKLRKYLDGLITREAFEKPIAIKPDDSTFTYQFPFAWQNGSYNLVKPVSFDLKLEQSITEKATLNVGQFTVLRPYAAQRSARFDVLVGRPKNKALYKSYDQAIRLLREQPYVQVVEEEQLDNYSQETAASFQ